MLPFEGRDEEVLWKVLVGEGDTPFLVEHDAAWCLNYWHYNKHLTYRFPLDLAGPAAKRLCVLETHGGGPRFRCLVGPDPRSLSPVEIAEHERQLQLHQHPGSLPFRGPRDRPPRRLRRIGLRSDDVR